MFYSNFFNLLVTIFVLSFVQVMDLYKLSKEEINTTNESDISSFDSDTYCKFQANSYRCSKNHRFSYFYDVEKNDCEVFKFGHCLHPYNVFNSLSSCKSECRDSNRYPVEKNVTANVFCRFQPQFGNCNSYHPKWFFDITEMKCRGFSFSGCGGNANRFDTKNQCMDVCGYIIKHCTDCVRYHYST